MRGKKIKNCPFCGNKGEPCGCQSAPWKKIELGARCSNVGCILWGSHYPLKLWNTRADIKEVKVTAHNKRKRQLKRAAVR